MKIQDDRHDFNEVSEVITHTNLIGGKDSFMSGWGRAKHGVSYAYWACTDDQVDRVIQWICSRSDQPNPKHIDDTQLPKGGPDDHLHIYCVRDGHPALDGA